MEWLTEHWYTLALALWPLLAFLATLTPNKFDDKTLQFLRDVLDGIAFNYGKAKNAGKKE